MLMNAMEARSKLNKKVDEDIAKSVEWLNQLVNNAIDQRFDSFKVDSKYLKEFQIDFLRSIGYIVIECGTHNYNMEYIIKF